MNVKNNTQKKKKLIGFNKTVKYTKIFFFYLRSLIIKFYLVLEKLCTVNHEKRKCKILYHLSLSDYYISLIASRYSLITATNLDHISVNIFCTRF